MSHNLNARSRQVKYERDSIRCPLHPGVGEVSPGASFAGLICRACGRTYPIRGGIAHFIPPAIWRRNSSREEVKQWDRESESYEDWRGRDPRYMAGIVAAARALAPQPDESVLDAGCGTGLTTRHIAAVGCRVTALDLSLRSLECLGNRVSSGTVRLIQGDLTALPFADASFDRVLCANTLQHLEGSSNRQACIRELVRVLRPGGRLVVTAQQYSVPRHRAGWVKEGSSGDRIRYIFRFRPAELRSLLETELIHFHLSGAGFPFPYKWKLGLLSRVAERIGQQFPSLTTWADLLVATATKPFAYPQLTVS